MTAAELILRSGTSTSDVARHLDGLTPHERTRQSLSLSPAQQRALWDIASAAPAPQHELIRTDAATQAFAGRNSLTLLSRFEKRFFRSAGQIFGYNKHALAWLIGPGYFAVAPRPGGGFLFDYRELPETVPAGWPAVRPNSAAFARTVYGDLVDEVVWVARDVLVGAAFRAGAPLSSYFVLVRVAA